MLLIDSAISPYYQSGGSDLLVLITEFHYLSNFLELSSWAPTFIQ